MPLSFKHARCVTGGLTLELDLSFMGGIVVGITGPNRSGVSEFLSVAEGAALLEAGSVEGFERCVLARESFTSAEPAQIRRAIDTALTSGADVIGMGPSFSLTDLAYQRTVLARVHELRRRGTIVVLASMDLDLLERHCDEVVIMRQGNVVERGDPREVIKNYRARVADELRNTSPPVQSNPLARHGDGRALIREVQMLGADGQPTASLRSGESAAVRVVLAFREPVEDPVVGILIRSRIGINVYGTNTELEKVPMGPCSAGDQLEVRFAFDCNLCAEHYTLTVASHDPDGTAHEWLEEAIAFSVSDTRYTAGVANLKAAVSVKRRGGSPVDEVRDAGLRQK